MKNQKRTLILLCCQIMLFLFCFNIAELLASDVLRKTPKIPKESSLYRTIENAKSYIVKNQNKDGGWPLVPGEKSDVEITALAIWALTDAGWGTGSIVIRRGVRYLRNKQREDGSWNNNTAHTIFALIALDNAKTDPDVQFDGLRWLKSAQNPSGSWGRKSKSPGHILYTAATLVGFKKLGFIQKHFEPILSGMEWLAEQNNFENLWNLQGGTQSDIFVTSWVLQGLLHSSKYDHIVYDLDEQMVWLKQFQNDDGGFGRFKGKPSDPEVTAAAIMALVAANDPLNTKRIAVAYLTKTQEPDGGFVSDTPIELKTPITNLQSTCFVLIAIYAKSDSDH